MNSDELAGLTISGIALKIRSRQVSPVELTRSCLERIEALQPVINSFITVMADKALDRARDCEREIMQGDYRGPLHGVPVGLKDNLALAGVTATIGSKILKNNVPDYDATVVSRLRDAGAIFMGKENMHEFAMGFQ
jgi:aspartyl-tRNA(Asn)/glutamyl-tRNA(Gln) amidotransferase subunit A